MPHGKGEAMPHNMPSPPQKQGGGFLGFLNLDNDDLEAIVEGMGDLMEDEAESEDNEAESENEGSGGVLPNADGDAFPEPNDDDQGGDGVVQGGPVDPSKNLTDDGEDGPITWIRDQFREYVDSNRRNLVHFDEAEQSSIGLMDLLRQEERGGPKHVWRGHGMAPEREWQNGGLRGAQGLPRLCEQTCDDE